MDCCQERLDGVRIYLDDYRVGTLSQTQSVQKYTFDVDRSGQVVLVNKTTTSALSMAEVVVMGVENNGKLRGVVLLNLRTVYIIEEEFTFYFVLLYLYVISNIIFHFLLLYYSICMLFQTLFLL